MWREVQDEPRKCLRQKPIVSSTATDRELFDGMDVGDVWSDGEIIQVWAYLYSNKRLRIPETWQLSLSNFNKTLMDLVLAPVLNYLMLRSQLAAF